MYNPYNPYGMRLSCPPPYAETGRSEHTMGGGTIPWTMFPWTPPWCKPHFEGPDPLIWWGNVTDQPTRSNQPNEMRLSSPPPGPWGTPPMEMVSWIPWWLLHPGKPWTSRMSDEESELNWHLATIPNGISLIPEEIKEKIFTFVEKELEGQTKPDVKSDNEYLFYFSSTISEITQKLYNSKEGKDIINDLGSTPSLRSVWGYAALGTGIAVVVACAAAYYAYKKGWL